MLLKNPHSCREVIGRLECRCTSAKFQILAVTASLLSIQEHLLDSDGAVTSVSMPVLCSTAGCSENRRQRRTSRVWLSVGEHGICHAMPGGWDHLCGTASRCSCSDGYAMHLKLSRHREGAYIACHCRSTCDIPHRVLSSWVSTSPLCSML